MHSIGPKRRSRSPVLVLFAGALALAAAGCPDAAGSADTAAPSVLGFGAGFDAEAASIRGTIVVRFSEPVAREAALDDGAVVLFEGVPSAADLSDILNPPITRAGVIACGRALEGDSALALTPLAPLRAGQRYTVVATSRVRDRAGNRLAPSPSLLALTTRPLDVRLVAPPLGEPAPANLALVALELDAAVDEPLAPGAVSLELEDGSATLPLGFAGPTTDGSVSVFRLPDGVPAGNHRIVVRSDEGEATLPLQLTAAPKRTPPKMGRPTLEAFDGSVIARVSVDGPALGRLWLGASEGALSPLGPPAFGRELVAQAWGLVDGPVFARVEVWGLAGPPRFWPAEDEPPMGAIVHRRIALGLSEVVTHPIQDWADRRCDCRPGGCGEPFDDLPGCAPRVGSESEYVEIVNRSGDVVDLLGAATPWRLRVVDASPEEVLLDPARVTLRFGPQSRVDALRPGDFVVVKPASPINNDARLELVDPFGAVVDAVALGQAGVPGGRATSLDDEAVSRDPTSGRWCKARATPGRENAPCPDA